MIKTLRILKSRSDKLKYRRIRSIPIYKLKIKVSSLNELMISSSMPTTTEASIHHAKAQARPQLSLA